MILLQQEWDYLLLQYKDAFTIKKKITICVFFLTDNERKVHIYVGQKFKLIGSEIGFFFTLHRQAQMYFRPWFRLCVDLEKTGILPISYKRNEIIVWDGISSELPHDKTLVAMKYSDENVEPFVINSF